MTKTTFTIGGIDAPGSTLKAVYAFIGNLDITKPWRITVEPDKGDRSLAQNSLYWKWLTIIGKERGHTKEEMHEEYKGRFLVPIFTRDDEEYAAMWETVRDVWRGGDKDGAELLRKQIIKLTSTTQASTNQMWEYLQDIERDAVGQGIHLPTRDDMYQQAMGRKRKDGQAVKFQAQ